MCNLGKGSVGSSGRGGFDTIGWFKGSDESPFFHLMKFCQDIVLKVLTS